MATEFTKIYLRKNVKGTGELRRMQSIVGHEPEWNDFSDSMLRAYRDSMLDDLCPSSARTYGAILKAIINEYKDEQAIPSRNYAKLLSVKSTPSQSVYLTEAEIYKLIAVKAKGNAETYVKSMFLLQCYTGCRHSDAQQLSLTNISGNWLTYVSIKTKTQTVIPLHTMVPSLIESMRACKAVTESYYERVIRVLCKRAGIDDATKIYRRGKESEGEKWRFVASHTGRRSFCTNLYMRGVDLHCISQWMGHADISMTERYLCAKRRLPDSAVGFFY